MLNGAEGGSSINSGGIAGQLEGEVALDGGGKIAGRAVVHGPASVGALVVADVLRHAAPDLVIARAEEVSEEQVLGVHGGVRLQLRPPEPFADLLAREPRLRPLDDEIQRRALELASAGDHETPRS